MTDNKLTDNKIIKALECCVSEQYTCEQCPYQEIKHYDYGKGFEIMPNGKQYDDWSCDRWLLTDALDLINRLQERVEKCEKVEYFADKAIATLQAENEKLNTFAEIKKEEIVKIIARAKAEAYKECFALIKNSLFIKHKTLDNECLFEFSGDDLDNIYKELVGE